MGIYLVCEGPTDGLDVRVLDLVIAQKLGREVQIIPAGGDRSLGSVAHWLEERSRAYSGRGLGDQAYVIEDRNFRSSEEVGQTWDKSDSKRWIWHRHEIENYLLDPRLVADTFRALKESHIRGADKLPDDNQEIFSLLQDLARPILEHHTGWLTYWHLVSLKNDIGDTRFLRPSSSLRSSANSSYPGQTEWLNYLSSESARLKEVCNQVSLNTIFDDANISEIYHRFLASVTDPEFLSSGQFLFDLGGHELMSALCAFINQTGISNLSSAGLESELIGALDRLYVPGFFDPDDFSQLADRLK